MESIYAHTGAHTHTRHTFLSHCKFNCLIQSPWNTPQTMSIFLSFRERFISAEMWIMGVENAQNVGSEYKLKWNSVRLSSAWHIENVFVLLAFKLSANNIITILLTKVYTIIIYLYVNVVRFSFSLCVLQKKKRQILGTLSWLNEKSNMLVTAHKRIASKIRNFSYIVRVLTFSPPQICFVCVHSQLASFEFVKVERFSRERQKKLLSDEEEEDWYFLLELSRVKLHSNGIETNRFLCNSTWQPNKLWTRAAHK